jgi:hypothetical protein
MPLLIGAGIVLLLLGGLWLLVTVDPTVLARVFRGTAIGALVLAGLFLAVRGLAVLDLPLGALIVYLLHHWSARGFPGVVRVKDWVAGRPRRAGGSTIETGMLRMTLDQASGALSGEVLAGVFAGAQMDQLSLGQLQALLGECAASDDQSVRLLETYLDRTHPDWREDAQSRQRPSGGGAMGRDEALQVLGLEAGAGPAQIRDAHRRLMAKLHPDHGGSDYLASKINAARDVLLKAA